MPGDLYFGGYIDKLMCFFSARSRYTFSFIAILTLLLLSLSLLESCSEGDATTVLNSKQVPEIVDFNFHVRPILSDRCYTCHGPDEKKREANLRLDTYQGAIAAIGKNKDHYAVVPGETEKSKLIERIFSDLPEDIMPPPESNLILGTP